MTTQLGEAQVPIRATTDKLGGDLARARGKVDGALKKLAGGLQTVGAGALGLGGAAVGVIAGIGAAIAKVTIDAAPVEGITQAFDGLADSAGIGGDAMLEALQKGSSGMISQRDLMLSFNKAASLVSTDFATKLPDAMQYLSKVSAATGQDIGYLMDSLVVGVGRLSPMILDNLAIQVSQAEATQRAAEMYGVQASALTKTQQQAGMMNVVLEKLAANTASMPDVTESAAAGMARLRAGFQDTKDTVGMAFMPTLTILLGLLADLAERVLPSLTDFLEGTLAPAFEHVAGVVRDFIWMLDVGIEPLSALKIALTQLVGPEVAKKIMGIIEAVSGFIETAKEGLGPIIEWITENVKLQDVFLALAVAIGIVVASVLGPLLGTIATAIAAFAIVMGVVALIRSAWESDFAGIRMTVETTLATIKQWWSEHGEEVKAKALEIWETVKTTISEKFEAAKEIISNAIATIKEWWSTHGDEIMAKATEIWEAVVATFEWFKGQFTLLFDAFRLAFEGDWEGFGEKLREYWDEAWAKIKEIGETVWAAIVKFFGETDWGKIGKDVLTGIAKGIKAGVSFISDAIKGVIQAALAAVTGFFGGGVDVPAGGYPGVPGQSAAGTDYWRGGLSWVGEQGPELLNVPRGAQILSTQNSLSLVSGLARVSQQLADAGRWMEMVARPRAAVAAGDGGQNVVIYGLTLEGVQDKRGLLAELQGLT